MADIGALNSKLESLRADLDVKIAALRAELSAIRWIIGIAIPGIVVQVLNQAPG